MFAMKGIPVFNFSINSTITDPIAKTKFEDLDKPNLFFDISPWEYAEWVSSQVFSLDEIKNEGLIDFIAENLSH
ncbi:hypothetical protein TetV_635 [Tetraselmis virus 1]|uniref:Uncharacterized protein n=1 Tax=Tetraselmis virus 1 TaxID=2060617 RepID=A0A2P0VP93_9VIRU|nr:hypothetical protein QJ968_gp419 [Tetraselmis virus 1]AUF82717.1 hypothetical protein TetV_635 [Tetraselmis virus 1]